MKTGLVLEGGAMRGMFTAGVLDVLMEHNIQLDGAVGVSAGAVFGCNYKSHQIGRTIRYNTEYCTDKRYASFGNLLRTGNLYSEQFCYHTVPEKLDPFDTEAFRENPMDFFVVCTDVRTGEPIYRKCRTGDAEDIQWMQASASMPLAAKIVKIGHYQLLDGGVADSIPVRFFESIGYKRNLIILTQPKGFVKQKNKMLPLIRARYVRYPAFVEAVADRHQRYNETLAYISMLEPPAHPAGDSLHGARSRPAAPRIRDRSCRGTDPDRQDRSLCGGVQGCTGRIIRKAAAQVCAVAFFAKRTIGNALRFLRVAAPSICIVPWTALASCWPLPQQLLPVSATGGGRRRCWAYSAEYDFYI